MNELIKQVTPLTRGIIWLVKDETNPNTTHYSDIDYLLDGLLTANLKSSTVETSRVIVGNNFNQSLFVMIIKEAKTSEIESYLSLFKNELGPENDIIVIDQSDGFQALKAVLKPISANLRIIQ